MTYAPKVFLYNRIYLNHIPFVYKLICKTKIHSSELGEYSLGGGTFIIEKNGAHQTSKSMLKYRFSVYRPFHSIHFIII